MQLLRAAAYIILGGAAAKRAHQDPGAITDGLSASRHPCVPWVKSCISSLFWRASLPHAGCAICLSCSKRWLFALSPAALAIAIAFAITPTQTPRPTRSSAGRTASLLGRQKRIALARFLVKHVRMVKKTKNARWRIRQEEMWKKRSSQGQQQCARPRWHEPSDEEPEGETVPWGGEKGPKH